jgi:hypothetical protein
MTMHTVYSLKWFIETKIHLHAGGAMRGRGWKYGSGFVDGVFPVLSPMAQDILDFVQKETDAAKIWESLDKIPPAHNLWDDILNVAVQLRLNRQLDPIISVRPTPIFQFSLLTTDLVMPVSFGQYAKLARLFRS